MSTYKLFSFASLFILLSSLTGCGVKTQVVEGKVTMDGSPLEGATVVFMPLDGGGQTAVGMTDASGTFKLNNAATKDGGLPAGTYKVIVTKESSVAEEINELAKTDPTAAMAKLNEKKSKAAATMPNTQAGYMMKSKGAMGGGATPLSKNSLPAKYSAAETTPISITLPHAEPIVIALEKK